MANSTANVTVGKPMTGGAVYVAPLGTTLPATAAATLDAAFEGLGYISEDGVVNSLGRTSENIKAWGGDIVLSPQTEKVDTWAMTFIESLNVTTLEQVFGSDNVSGDLTSGIVVKANSKELDHSVWVIDMLMNGGYKKRVVIPNGQITATGEVTYADNSAVGFNATITAFPGGFGAGDDDTHKEYIAQP